MIGKVFRIFRERKGLLKALDLWDWFESIPHEKQKKVKYYFSLKSIKDIKFPFRAKHFDSEDVENVLYTKRTFLGSIAQMAFLERDFHFAHWLYLEALKQEGTPYEAHLILNDLVLLAQNIKDFEKAKTYSKMDLDLFEDYKDHLKTNNGNIHINSLDVYIYLLEKEGKFREALDLLEDFKNKGVEVLFYEDVKKRLQSKV